MHPAFLGLGGYVNIMVHLSLSGTGHLCSMSRSPPQQEFNNKKLFGLNEMCPLGTSKWE